MLSTKRHGGRLATSALPRSSGKRHGHLSAGTAEEMAAGATAAEAQDATSFLVGEEAVVVTGLDIHLHLSSLQDGARGGRGGGGNKHSIFKGGKEKIMTVVVTRMSIHRF